MKMNNINAIDLLKQIVKKRMWHKGRIEPRLAAMTKINVTENKLSYEKASAILELLGWEKVQEESWAETNLQKQGAENIAMVTKAIKAIYPDDGRGMDKRLRFKK